VERGELDTPATRALVERAVRPLVEAGADTIVLGCTHYPFLLPLVEDAAGPGVVVLDPAVAVARELRRRLEDARALSAAPGEGRVEFFTSGAPADVARVLADLWSPHATVQALPDSVIAR
jgi:glutamate racemase